MNSEIHSVGQWYLRPDTHETFHLIDWDDQSGAVRIQMCDGSLDEIDEDTWRALLPEPVEAPEDWAGPLDSWDIGALDESVMESDVPSEEAYFRDDREPSEILMAEEEAMAA